MPRPLHTRRAVGEARGRVRDPCAARARARRSYSSRVLAVCPRPGAAQRPRASPYAPLEERRACFCRRGAPARARPQPSCPSPLLTPESDLAPQPLGPAAHVVAQRRTSDAREARARHTGPGCTGAAAGWAAALQRCSAAGEVTASTAATRSPRRARSDGGDARRMLRRSAAAGAQGCPTQPERASLRAHVGDNLPRRGRAPRARGVRSVYISPDCAAATRPGLLRLQRHFSPEPACCNAGVAYRLRLSDCRARVELQSAGEAAGGATAPGVRGARRAQRVQAAFCRPLHRAPSQAPAAAAGPSTRPPPTSWWAPARRRSRRRPCLATA